MKKCCPTLTMWRHLLHYPVIKESFFAQEQLQLWYSQCFQNLLYFLPLFMYFSGGGYFYVKRRHDPHIKMEWQQALEEEDNEEVDK